MQTRLVELEVSFQTSNGNSPGNGVPQGPRVSQVLSDIPEDLVGYVDYEIISPVPPLLPSTWQPDMRSQAVLAIQGNSYTDPTLLLTFDDRPGGVRKAYMQANEWPIPSPDFNLSLLPPDGTLWMYSRSTLDTQSHSLAAALLLAVEAGDEGGGPTGPLDGGGSGEGGSRVWISLGAGLPGQ